MNMSRRLFFSLLLVRPRQSVSLRVAVLETFAMNGKVSAILVNHAEPLERDQFARWLQAHPRSVVRIRNNAGEETAASIFRVRMCFGRGLVLLNQPITVRQREVLTRIERNLSECHIAFSIGDGYSPVILGEPGDSALLGAVTLENLGLVFNPFSRTLHPMKLLLA
jgi:hypothetical protein